QHFVKVIVSEAKQRQRHFPDLPPLRLPSRLRFRTFDDLYTAPRCGFVDALDYYHKGGVEHLVPRIPISTFIVSSGDDPFICVKPFARMRLPANVEVRLVPAGGHAGFVGLAGGGVVRWAECRVVDWLGRSMKS